MNNLNITQVSKKKLQITVIIFALVNAIINIGLLYKASLQSAQDNFVEILFMFIFILAFIFKEKIPGIREKLDRSALFHKISGIILVITGLALLFLNQK